MRNDSESQGCSDAALQSWAAVARGPLPDLALVQALVVYLFCLVIFAPLRFFLSLLSSSMSVMCVCVTYASALLPIRQQIEYLVQPNHHAGAC